jgi:predicted dehydrogenase
MSVGIGVIGLGYWGPNLLRNFADIPNTRVIGVSDLDEKKTAAAQARYPTTSAWTDYRELLASPKVDAVAIATPVSTHFEIAMAAIEAGKHVMVEKPMAATSTEAARLIEAAARRRVVLMVGHTFVYTSAVRKIAELISSGDLGEAYYYDSVRVNLGLFQRDVNVVWDLAVHDLSIMDHVLPARPRAISATGMSHVPGEPENIAFLTLFFADRLIAHVHVNWLAPVKIRRTLIGGSQKMIVYDELDLGEKVRVYDKGISVTNTPDAVYQMLVSYRAGDMWAPRLDGTEPLRTETMHFVDCVTNNRTPRSDGESGLRVVRLVEAATRSLAERGRLVELGD